MSNCPECAQPVEPDSLFCVRCGAALPDTGDLSYFQSLFRDENEPEPPPTHIVSGGDAESLVDTRVRPDPVTSVAAPGPDLGTAPHIAPRPGSGARPSRSWTAVLLTVMLVLVLVVVAGIAVAVIVIGGAGGGQAGPPPVTTSSTPRKPDRTGGSGVPSLPPGATICGAGVAVGPNTTCEFAQNVATAVWAAGPENPLRVKAHSPVTNRTYELVCVRGSWVKCTGGSNATVYVLPR